MPEIYHPAPQFLLFSFCVVFCINQSHGRLTPAQQIGLSASHLHIFKNLIDIDF